MASLAQMAGQLDPRVQQAQEQYTHVLKKVLDEKEKAIDEKIKAMETMDEDDFERLREKRKAAMVKAQQQRQKNLLNGHGRYMELSHQKEFFDACKASKMVVVHFYRSTTWRCQVVDKHLERLSQEHLETRFVKIDAEKSPFLVERLHIIMLPSIVCVKDGKTEHTIIGFDELGGSDEFPTETLAYVLSKHKVLRYDGPEPDAADEDGNIAPDGVNKIDMRRGIREGVNEAAAESDDELEEFMGGFVEEEATEGGEAAE